MKKKEFLDKWTFKDSIRSEMENDLIQMMIEEHQADIDFLIHKARKAKEKIDNINMIPADSSWQPSETLKAKLQGEYMAYNYATIRLKGGMKEVDMKVFSYKHGKGKKKD